MRRLDNKKCLSPSSQVAGPPRQRWNGESGSETDILSLFGILRNANIFIHIFKQGNTTRLPLLYFIKA